MWELMVDDDRLRLRSGALAEADLDFASVTLLGTVPEDLSGTHQPLYTALTRSSY